MRSRESIRTDHCNEIMLIHALKRISPGGARGAGLWPATTAVEPACLNRRTTNYQLNDTTRYSNRLTACLKLYFPQIFEDVTSPLVGALLQQWPSLVELQRAHYGTLRKSSISRTAPSIGSRNASMESAKQFRPRPTRPCCRPRRWRLGAFSR